jgi:hypothetical protein
MELTDNDVKLLADLYRRKQLLALETSESVDFICRLLTEASRIEIEQRSRTQKGVSPIKRCAAMLEQRARFHGELLGAGCCSAPQERAHLMFEDIEKLLTEQFSWGERFTLDDDEILALSRAITWGQRPAEFDDVAADAWRRLLNKVPDIEQKKRREANP